MLSDMNTIKSFSSRWSGPSYWSPALGRRGGVAILISQNSDGKVVSWQKVSSGCVISLLMRYNNIDFNVINIYAPAVISERKIFLDGA